MFTTGHSESMNVLLILHAQGNEEMRIAPLSKHGVETRVASLTITSNEPLENVVLSIIVLASAVSRSQYSKNEYFQQGTLD